MKEIHKSPAREHLISCLRNRLAENRMMITEESLEFTAKRYAAMIMSNPELDARKLIEEDIDNVKAILAKVNSSYLKGKKEYLQISFHMQTGDQQGSRVSTSVF